MPRRLPMDAMSAIDAHTLALLELDKVLPEFERRADSARGRELIGAMRPLATVEMARQAQQRTREWLALEAGEPAPGRLGVPDLRAALRAVARGDLLEPAELLQVRELTAASAALRDVVEVRGEAAPCLTGELEAVQPFPELDRQIDRAIGEAGEVRDDASPELRTHRRTIARLRQRLEARLEQLSTGLGPASFVTRRGDRLTVAVPTEKLGTLHGVVHDRSASGATVFLEPLEVVDDQNRLRGAEAAERAEILRILRALADQVHAHAAALDAAAAGLAHADRVRATARYLRDRGATLPRLTDGGPLRLRGGRHPLLERALDERGETLVPVDLELGERHRVLVVTGPNMGGKTVTLKTLGLLTLMAMSGLPVPAREGTVMGFFERIVADIGDEQSIEHNLSTFASHLRQISAAIESAGPGVLVLLDELGAGTDPSEGGALGQAVLEHLVGSRALVVVTTHHGELKGMAVRHPAIANASMAFDLETHAPRYELVIGVPGRSFALEVGRRLGLRAAVLDRARQLVAGDESRLQELLIDLEARRAAAVDHEGELVAERRRLAATRAHCEARLERLREARDRIQLETRREAERLLAELREALRAARRAARQGGASGAATTAPTDGAPPSAAGIEALGREAARLGAASARLGPRAPQMEGVSPAEIVPGRRLWARSLGADVEVLAAPDRGGRVRVRRGALTLELDQRQLAPVATPPGGSPPPAPTATPATGGILVDGGEPPSLELDLRGMTGDEAVEAVERHLDRALLHNLPAIRIIHGKGTGALRERVQAAIAAHPQVSRHRLGELNEGGAGVTIVELG